MDAQPRPCRGGRATSRERGGIGIAAGGKGEPPPPPPYTISDDDRGSPQTPGAGSAVGLGRRSVGLEPHESPTTPPHRRDGRTRCQPMQAAASTAPAILAAARRHAPARKRGYRRRSRAACVVIRAAPGHSCSMQHADCMDLPLHRRADSTFRISLKMQNADAECRMQNPAQNVYSVCAACRMQDAGCRIGPKMDSSA